MSKSRRKAGVRAYAAGMSSSVCSFAYDGRGRGPACVASELPRGICRRHVSAKRALLLVAAAAAFGSWQSASAGFPERPLRIIQGFSIGGISDTLARIIGDKLGAQIGQPVVVEARPGAGGLISMRAAYEATPDGYTMLLGNSAITVSPQRSKKPPFDPMKVLVPVSMIGTAPSILLANPSRPIHSVKELIEYAKERPGKVDCATSGIGTTNDLGVHLLNYMAHVKILNVPYKGSGPSLNAVLGDETPLSFAPLLPSIPHVKYGRLTALGVSSAERNAALPDVPAIAETIPGYEDVGFYSLVAHYRTPRKIVERLHKEINEALADAQVRDRLEKFGVNVKIMSRRQFAEFIHKDAAKWANLVQQAHLVL